MLRRRFEALRRDIAMVLDDVRGKRPSPLVERPTRRRAFAPSATAAAARPMIVREVRRETADATVVVLGEASGAPVAFVPGQFLTVMLTIDGEVYRRAYSICSDVEDNGTVAVCAKRIAGGRVSTYLHEKLVAGDTVHVLGPSGEFTVAPDAAAERSLVLIAGGSGITPILAILRAVLAKEPRSRATLIYGNRRKQDVIFRAEIDALAAKHTARFRVSHVLEENGGARLDRAGVGTELDRIDAGADTDYFVCGPAAAMAAVREELLARGVAAARIREERFATPERRAGVRTAQRLSIRTGKGAVDAVVAPDATLLDAGLAAGVAMPYSCAMGGCGACAVRLVDGDVDLDEPNCLTPAERAAGRILACVARPTGPCTVEVP
jgi:ring-1,2-phenylacetyl-CoA epoxidase subunit PaaE